MPSYFIIYVWQNKWLILKHNNVRRSPYTVVIINLFTQSETREMPQTSRVEKSIKVVKYVVCIYFLMLFSSYTLF